MDSSLHYAHSRQLQLTSTGDFNWRTKNAIVADRNGFHHRQQLVRPKDIAAECVSSFFLFDKNETCFFKRREVFHWRSILLLFLNENIVYVISQLFAKNEVHLLSRSIHAIFNLDFQIRIHFLTVSFSGKCL